MSRFAISAVLAGALLISGCDGKSEIKEKYFEDINLLVEGVWALSFDKAFDKEKYKISKTGNNGDYHIIINEESTGYMVETTVKNICYLDMIKSRIAYGNKEELGKMQIDLRSLDYKKATESCVKDQNKKCVFMTIDVPGIEDNGVRSKVVTEPQALEISDVLTVFTYGHLDRFQTALGRLSKICGR